MDNAGDRPRSSNRFYLEESAVPDSVPVDLKTGRVLGEGEENIVLRGTTVVWPGLGEDDSVPHFRPVSLVE